MLATTERLGAAPSVEMTPVVNAMNDKHRAGGEGAARRPETPLRDVLSQIKTSWGRCDSRS
jgi:hypothetical protein